MIESLFPASVVTVEATPAMWDADLLPEEEAAIAQAVSKRRREFAAGRACARQGLIHLGVHPASLPVAFDRLPRWPEGVIGSISHCEDFCAAAVARSDAVAGLGLDVERAEPLDATLLPIVCGEEELEGALRATGLSLGVAAKLLFSAKEAAYKGCYPRTRQRWDFDDVRIRVDRRGSFMAELWQGAALEGRYVFAGEWVFTGVTLF